MGVYYKSNTFKNKKGMTVVAIHCSGCNNERNWHLMSYTNWFSLLVIPLFPTSHVQYLECQCCHKQIEVHKGNKEKIERLFDKAILWDKRVYYSHELL